MSLVFDDCESLRHESLPAIEVQASNKRPNECIKHALSHAQDYGHGEQKTVYKGDETRNTNEAWIYYGDSGINAALSEARDRCNNEFSPYPTSAFICNINNNGHVSQHLMVKEPYVISLFDYSIHNGNDFDTEKARMILRKIKEFVYAGHIHNDMHAGNVLFDGKTVYLIDFEKPSRDNEYNNLRDHHHSDPNEHYYEKLVRELIFTIPNPTVSTIIEEELEKELDNDIRA